MATMNGRRTALDEQLQRTSALFAAAKVRGEEKDMQRTIDKLSEGACAECAFAVVEGWLQSSVQV